MSRTPGAAPSAPHTDMSGCRRMEQRASVRGATVKVREPSSPPAAPVVSANGDEQEFGRVRDASERTGAPGLRGNDDGRGAGPASALSGDELWSRRLRQARHLLQLRPMREAVRALRQMQLTAEAEASQLSGRHFAAVRFPKEQLEVPEGVYPVAHCG